MHTYARIDNGIVMEVIQPMTYDIDSPEGCEYTFKAGDEIPIERRFTPEFVSTLSDITGISPQPEYGWTATQNGSTWEFAEPSTPQS
jgi:hypothetical protein